KKIRILYEMKVDEDRAANIIRDDHESFDKKTLYTRAFTVRGTKGMIEETSSKNAYIYFEGMPGNEVPNEKDLLEQYMDGMNMLMSIGFELRIDELKPYEEITQPIKADDLMFKIYAGILSLKDTLNPIAYQNVLDDYLHLGFLLKITFDDMMNELK
ncbi:MAG: dUTP diphosphatase, partial [bacterium]